MKMKKLIKHAGTLFGAVTQSPKLRVLAATGITAGFAFLGMHVDGDTALAMIGAAGMLAGWGPVPETAPTDGAE
jgi:hypothetical protein